MTKVKMLSLPGGEISLYGLLMILFCAAAFGAMVCSSPKGRRRSQAIYGVLASVLGLLLGRAIYCAVRSSWMFYDELGDFAGIGPFFQFGNGSANVIGILLGCLLSAFLAGKITGERAGALLDRAALWGMLLFSLARFIEPLSGQGYGDFVDSEALQFFPVSLSNDWGDYSLSVCFIEGVLGLIICAALLSLKKRCKKPGTLSLIALALLCASQIMPESMRRDNVLKIFIFARVTQMGYAILLAAALISSLLSARRRGVSGKKCALEFGLLFLGALVCIGAEFALDKTNWPHVLIYIVMVLTLAFMAWVVISRVWKEEKAVR